jgi:hypothetical protein
MRTRMPYLAVAALLLCALMPLTDTPAEAARAGPARVVDVLGQPADLVNAPALDLAGTALPPELLRAPLLVTSAARRDIDTKPVRVIYRDNTAGNPGWHYLRRWGSPLRTCTTRKPYRA